jgi:methanogenic corrinoid protein MtbC1
MARTSASAGHLSIGAVARATGIPAETIRTWEMRYGFPDPERAPSGHRLYSVGNLPRLRRIAEALRQGHRAGQVVPASERDLKQLLASMPAMPSVESESDGASLNSTIAKYEGAADLLPAIRTFDRDTLTRVLLSDCARLGTMGFLDRRVAPLVEAVGQAWAAGTLTVTHEHFLSERLGDLLRLLRAPLEERAAGPLVVLATLPGETHALGLQMAALAIASGGCRLLVLGAEVPIDALIAIVRDQKARGLGVSVSASTAGRDTSAVLRRLRRRLPRRVSLVVGGQGAPVGLPGVVGAKTLRAALDWARRL